MILKLLAKFHTSVNYIMQQHLCCKMTLVIAEMDHEVRTLAFDLRINGGSATIFFVCMISCEVFKI